MHTDFVLSAFVQKYRPSFMSAERMVEQHRFCEEALRLKDEELPTFGPAATRFEADTILLGHNFCIPGGEEHLVFRNSFSKGWRMSTLRWTTRATSPLTSGQRTDFQQASGYSDSRVGGLRTGFAIFFKNLRALRTGTQGQTASLASGAFQGDGV